MAKTVNPARTANKIPFGVEEDITVFTLGSRIISPTITAVNEIIIAPAR